MEPKAAIVMTATRSRSTLFICAFSRAPGAGGGRVFRCRIIVAVAGAGVNGLF